MRKYRSLEWWTKFRHKFYIPDICNTNMFILLPINEKHYKNVMKQRNFIYGLTGLYKYLRPSNYGSQTPNFKIWSAFNEHILKVAKEREKEYYKDWEDNE